MQLILSPAYGRDYKSKKALLEDWNSDKDFIIENIMHPDCGRYINREQVDGPSVNVRYKAMAKVAVITRKAEGNWA